MKINIITLGCSKNIVDSEHIAGHLRKAGFEIFFDGQPTHSSLPDRKGTALSTAEIKSNPAKNQTILPDRQGAALSTAEINQLAKKQSCLAPRETRPATAVEQSNHFDIVIVNTCGFIGDAKEESINVLLEQIALKKRSRKKSRLIAVGCLIQRYEKELREELPEIDAFYGVHQWGELVRSLEAEYHDCLEAERIQSTPKHYAYLKISEGCNRTCSYCAIPLIRGKHVSRPIDDIVDEAKRMVADGVKELIIIAQDTTYYGLDLYGKRMLGTLLERLATEVSLPPTHHSSLITHHSSLITHHSSLITHHSSLPWIRLHYTYPSSFPLDAIDVIRRHPNICNYIDIPLQHINTRILTSMQRGIDREGTLRLLDHFRRELPDVAVRTTLIVGYPGETREEFEELKEFVRTARFDRMGCFAYSPEEGTAAYDLPDDVPQEEKERRVAELMELQEQISLEKNLARVGHTYDVLIDRMEGDYLVGRTQYDSPEVDDEVLIPIENLKLKIENSACANDNSQFSILLPGSNGDTACDRSGANSQFTKVRITAAETHDLYGELV